MNHYRNALTVAIIFIFYTYVHGYINFLTQSSDTAPVNWVMGFLVLALPVLIGELSRSDRIRAPLILWCFAYAWISVVGFVLSPQSDMAWQEVRWRVFAIIQLIIFFFLFSDKQAVRLARQALIGGVLLGVGLNIYELFSPMSFSFVQGRAAGLYQNPNLAGEALVMGMLCSVGALPSRFRTLFILVVGVGVFATLSRGGILAWVIAVMGLMFAGGVRVRDFLIFVSMGGLLAALILIPWFAQQYSTFGSAGLINKDVGERLEWLMDPTGVSDHSSWERAYLAKQAWDKVAEHPFIGSGTGSSREAVIGAHNQYLAFMQDYGILGAAILPLLVIAVMWEAKGQVRRMGLAFGLTTLVLSFFTHTMVDQTYSLILFALTAASAREGGKIKETQVLNPVTVARQGLLARR